MAADCIHEIPADTCAYCKPRPVPDPFRTASDANRSTIVAQFDSKCPECGDDIDGGIDQIYRNRWGSWVHSDC